MLKGNQSEILSCIAATGTDSADAPQQRGVDSGPGDSDIQKLGAAIRGLATLRKNIVVMTGKTDYVTDGNVVLAIDNGHEYLGMVTGTGCCLGTTISAYISAASGGSNNNNNRLTAVVAALLHYNIAAEIAAERITVEGPGTFVPAFLDELHSVRKATVRGALSWLSRAKVTILPAS